VAKWQRDRGTEGQRGRTGKSKEISDFRFQSKKERSKGAMGKGAKKFQISDFKAQS
jgi:hypothetical protein